MWLRTFGNARRWIDETEVLRVGIGDPLAASIPASCGGGIEAVVREHGADVQFTCVVVVVVVQCSTTCAGTI